MSFWTCSMKIMYTFVLAYSRAHRCVLQTPHSLRRIEVLKSSSPAIREFIRLGYHYQSSRPNNRAGCVCSNLCRDCSYFKRLALESVNPLGEAPGFQSVSH